MLATIEPSGGEHSYSETHLISGTVGDRAKMALKLIKMAAESGHGEANAVLGRIYESGGYQNNGRFYPILKKNKEKALEHYKLS